MRGFVGIGKSNVIEEAIEEATTGLKNADLLILYAPYKKAAEAAALLAAKYPGVPMIGTTGASIASVKGSTSSTDDQQIVVTAFAGVTVACGLMDQVNTAPIASIKQFEQDVKSVDGNSSNTVCLEFVTGTEERVISSLATVLNRYSISLVGGSAYGVPLGEKHLVVYNGKIYNRSCVYCVVKNNAGRIKVYKENIYERMHKIAYFATLVDTNTKTLFQLNGEPSLDIYTSVTGCEKENITSTSITNPLGRGLGDDTVIASIESVDMNGVLFSGKAIYDNDSIYVMELSDYRTIHEELMNEIQKNTNRISFIFGCDSIKRLQLFTTEGYLEDYTQSFDELGNHALLLGGGEQFNNQHMNQTLVLAVFE